ncbi:MAG TPA: SIMPL domain-containing protein, partial [Gaiellaceae bacterium]|nr:SIMPL domain-containing protein [Gaiellaceae bacterium]
GYSASNSVSAVSDVADAPALVDAAVEAGANTVSGPSMSSTNAEELYRQALADAVAEARARAEVLAKAANRSLGEITSISEATAGTPVPYYAERAALDAATPIVPGKQDTTATVTVTFTLR